MSKTKLFIKFLFRNKTFYYTRINVAEITVLTLDQIFNLETTTIGHKQICSPFIKINYLITKIL